MLGSFDGGGKACRGRGSIPLNRSMPNLLEPEEATIHHDHEYPNPDKVPALPGNATTQPQRRNTLIFPSTEGMRAVEMLPVAHGRINQPFFISPWPKSSKRATSNEYGMDGASSRSIRYGIMTGPRHEAAAQSDPTEVEYRHKVQVMEKQRRSEFPRRLVTAIVGGLFVIVPMLIMSIHGTKTKSLVTSTISVFLFAMTLAWTSTSDDVSLFLATAGYAAYLAVFVPVGDGRC
ncbi:hypothetical protein F5Y18DRAFT_223840 [Xylariaceae sp. FL1019]|nr:hypothetical protein F5Y18DRAFT_223840 [Xylariaceae sp. FL1019]